jgi:hypothetical protein
MLNYLARRTNPTPYYLFDRTSSILWGEDVMTDSLRAAAPDWIVLVARTSARNPFLTTSYLPLREWIAAHYTTVWQVGSPFQGEPAPGVMLLRRNPGPTGMAPDTD